MLTDTPFFSLRTNTDGCHVNDPIYLPELPCAQNLLFFQLVEGFAPQVKESPQGHPAASL